MARPVDTVPARVTEDGALVVTSAEPVGSASEPGTTVTVNTTSGQVIGANGGRHFLVFTNPNGPGDVWLRFGTGPATVGAGMWLPAGGEQPLPTGAMITSAVQAIATVAGTNIAVVEW